MFGKYWTPFPASLVINRKKRSWQRTRQSIRLLLTRSHLLLHLATPSSESPSQGFLRNLTNIPKANIGEKNFTLSHILLHFATPMQILETKVYSYIFSSVWQPLHQKANFTLPSYMGYCLKMAICMLGSCICEEFYPLIAISS